MQLFVDSKFLQVLNSKLENNKIYLLLIFEMIKLRKHGILTIFSNGERNDLYLAHFLQDDFGFFN